MSVVVLEPCISRDLPATQGSEDLCWAQIHLDVVDALVSSLNKEELASCRLVCAAWRASADSCIKELRPKSFVPKELAMTFKALNRLDLHALEDVTDKQLQDLAAAQHVPHEDSLLAQYLRQLNGGSICGRSECPSVTGTLSRADSFGSIGEAVSEAASSTAASHSKQMTPLRRRLGRPPRGSSSHHSKAGSMESIGSISKSAVSRIRLPFTPADPTASTSYTPGIASQQVSPEQPSLAQPISPTHSVAQSFHSAASDSTQSHDAPAQQMHTRSSQQKRRAHQVPLREDSIGAPQPTGFISAHRPASQQGTEASPALAWLTSLDISQCWRITDAGVAALAGLTTLEELDISCCNVNRMGFAAIATLPHLNSLTLAKATLSPGSLECFGDITGLRRLSVTLCTWDPADEPFAAALGKLTKLQDLRLANCRSLQDQELAQLLPKLTGLQRLDLAECYKLTEGGLRKIQFPVHLTALDLSRVAVNDTVLSEQIKELTDLSHLNLLGCHQISDHGLKQLLEAVSGLTFLDVSSCRGISDVGLQRLSLLERLQLLVMNNMDAGVAGDTLTGLHGLKELHTISSAGCAGFTAAGVKAIGGMPGLRELNLRGWMPNASLLSLTALQTLHGVEALNLARWPIGGSLEQAVLGSIGNHMGRLMQLDLAESLVGGKGLRELAGLCKLSRLSLKCCCNVSDNALKAVSLMSSLTWLNLHFCKAVSDKGLLHLASLLALSHLDIGFCSKVTDRGIAHLAHLPALTHVRMAGCHRIKLYQESREASGRVDVQQWANFAQTSAEVNQRPWSWKRMLCSCTVSELESA